MPRSEADSGSRRLFGRGKGRPLSPRQQALCDTLMPALALPEGPFDPRALFPTAREARLEIGFGAGDHLVAQALAHPDVGFIGAEFFREGVGKALARIDDARRQGAALANVRLHQGDGREILERIAPASLALIYVLFPDPWPKTRHHKRRLIQPDTVALMARALVRGGRLRVATDVRSYVDWTLQHVRAHGGFSWRARRPADWRAPPADHVRTRYETKNIGDCPPTYLDFVRRAGAAP